MDWSKIAANKHCKVPGTMQDTPKNRRLIANRKKRKKANAQSKTSPKQKFYEADHVLKLLQTKSGNSIEACSPAGTITLEKRREVVAGYRKLIGDLGATHFITFMPGRMVKPETIAKNIVQFCKFLERKALGKKWSKCMEDRIRLVGFLEKPDVTPHYHAAAFLPECTRRCLQKCGLELWKKFAPPGKLDAPLIKSVAKVASYITKDLHHYWAPENVVIYGPIERKR